MRRRTDLALAHVLLQPARLLAEAVSLEEREVLSHAGVEGDGRPGVLDGLGLVRGRGAPEPEVEIDVLAAPPSALEAGPEVGLDPLHGPVERPHGVSHHAVGDLGGEAHGGTPERRDPDRDLLPEGGRRRLQLREVGPVVLAFERLQALVGAAHYVANRGNSLAQVRKRLVLGRAEDAARPGLDAGPQAQGEAPVAQAVHVDRGHGGLEGAADRRDRDAAREPHPLGGGRCRREGDPGGPVDLRCEQALEALRLGLLGHGDERGGGQGVQDPPVAPTFRH